MASGGQPDPEDPGGVGEHGGCRKCKLRDSMPNGRNTL